MAEQEFREKIAKIIYHTGCTGACCECDYSKVSDADTYCKALLKADALIAEGLRFGNKHKIFVENAPISTTCVENTFYLVPNTPPTIKQLYGDEEVEQIVKERDEYKYRAEIAEKIAEEACEIVFCEAIDNKEWDEVIRNYKETKEKYSDEFGITDEMLYDYLHEKAEKELEKEKKDER